MEGVLGQDNGRMSLEQPQLNHRRPQLGHQIIPVFKNAYRLAVVSHYYRMIIDIQNY